MKLQKMEHEFKGCERVEKSPPPVNLGFAVITISTSRSKENTEKKSNDTSGDIIAKLLKKAKH
ncbi:MAG: hypothetical protein ACE5KO_05005, partial [Candidatus Bathyarchaeia archaeon]